MAGTVTYTVTKREIVAAQRVHHLRRLVSRQAFGWNAITLAIVWLLAFWGGFYSWDTIASAAHAATVITGMALVGGLSFAVFGYYLSGNQAARLYEQQRGLREECQADWSNEGLTTRSSLGTAEMAWGDYHGWRREALGYLVYLSDYYFYFLPRRAFSNEQWADFEHSVAQSGLPRRGGSAKVAKDLQPDAASRRLSFPRWWRGPGSSPGRVAILWAICTALYVLDNMLFQSGGYGAPSAVLYASGTQVFAGLLAGWALQLRARTLEIAELFLKLTSVFVLVSIGVELLSFEQSTHFATGWFGFIPTVIMAAFIGLRYRRRSGIRRFVAILLIFAANAAGTKLGQADRWFWGASEHVRARLNLEPPPDPDVAAMEAMHDIPADRLWGAQPRLVGHAIERLTPRVSGRANIYAMAAAADGSQQLFSREAKLALKVAAARFGGDFRGGVLLSNGLADILHTPFATRDNLASAAQGIGDRIDPAKDIALVYLASHGSRTAELSTDLPTYDQLTPISSRSLAEALARSGIKRRVIIVSACYAGSWIPALANDDTIIITAARKDRTSFGCDDTRNVTNFGEAFLNGPLAHGASLREAFDYSRKAVAGWEARDRLTPSEPQAYVGKNMRAVWTARGSAAGEVGWARTASTSHLDD